MENRREFYVDTPLGKLRVYAKYDCDKAEDYPGVYIDFVRTDENGFELYPDDNMICCVEYDPEFGQIQTHPYEYRCEYTAGTVVNYNPEDEEE